MHFKLQESGNVPEARWPEDELKPHRGSALTTERTPETGAPHACSGAEFPEAIGGAMKRLVLREDEARAKGTFPLSRFRHSGIKVCDRTAYAKAPILVR